MLLMLFCMGMRADVITINSSKGSFARNDSYSSDYKTKWTSSSSVPTLSLTCASEGRILPNQSGTDHYYSGTYTLSVSEGWKITQFSITGQSTSGEKITWNASDYTFSTSASETRTFSPISSQSTSFVLSDGSKSTQPLKVSSFTVTVLPDAIEDGEYTACLVQNTSCYIAADFTSNITPVHLLIKATGSNDANGCPTYKIQNANDNKYAVYTSTSNKTSMSWVVTPGDGQYDTYNVAQTGTFYVIRPSGQTTTYWTAWSSSAGAALYNYEPTSYNLYKWTLERYVDVAYKLMFNSSAIKSVERTEKVGDSPTSSTTVFGDRPAYCDYGDPDVATITSETTEIKVDLEWDGPFEISTDFNTATWYYMTNNNTHYLYYSSEGVDSYKILITDDNLSGAGINAMWAFVGNPYDGIRVINLGAGNGKYLNLNTKAEMVEATYPTYSLCDIIEGTGYFKLKNGEYYLVNDNNNGLVIDNREIWYNSTWAQYQVSAVDFKSLALDLIDDYANNHALGQYFGVATATYNSVRATCADAASVSASDYTSLLSHIEDMLPVNYPTTGYYHIKNNHSGQYMAYGNTAKNTSGAVITVPAGEKDYNASTVFHLEKVSNTQYKLSTQGGYVQTVNSANTQVNIGAVAVTYNVEITSPGVIVLQNDGNKFNSTTGHLMQSSTWVSENGYTHEGVISWNKPNNYSKWVVEEATSLSVTLNNGGDAYYATFCAPFSYTISEGTTAYTLGQSGEWLVPTAVVGEVTAGTPVLLKGTASSATLTIGSSYAATPLTSTSLSGTYLAKDFALTAGATAEYFLGKKAGVMGFYHSGIASKEGYYTLGANKAYLTSDQSARGYAIKWDDSETTGINDVIGKMSDVRDGAYYDLQGRKVAKPSRGLYIINGHKVVIK